MEIESTDEAKILLKKCSNLINILKLNQQMSESERQDAIRILSMAHYDLHEASQES